MESLKTTRECRIKMTDTVQDSLYNMSEGNPGALRVLMDLLLKSGDIDQAAAMGGFAPLLNLDMMGIYGSRIWILYKDQCGEDLERMNAVIRASQLGFFKEPDQVLNAVSDETYRGQTLDVDGALAFVKERLGSRWVSPV